MSRSIPQPNYTQFPNVLLDHEMAELTDAEWRCVCYIVRHTFGFHRGGEAISLSQFAEGICGLDRGTGLERRSVERALSTLEERGILIRTRRKAAHGGAMPNVYSLNLAAVDTES